MENYFSAVVGILSVAYILIRRNRHARRIWTRPYCSEANRLQFGEYHNLIGNFRLTDPMMLTVYLRMSPSLFDELVNKIGPKIQRKDTNFRKAISVGERLAITLRYFASGESRRSIAFSFRVGHSTVCKILQEVSVAIYDALVDEYLPSPHTLNWRSIAQKFDDRWNFPNCIGALDGKHIRIQAPRNSGSLYFNYKHYFSIVMLGMCDADYCFTMLDIGAFGKESDGGIFAASKFRKALKQGKINIPQPCKLQNSEKVLPYVLVADEAFPLDQNILRPYPGRGTGILTHEEIVFNYRLSRARRTIESAFGILTERWRLLRNLIHATPKNVVKFVKACVLLHNYVIKSKQGVEVTQSAFEQNFEASVIHELDSSVLSAVNVRDSYADYFVNEGIVPWQNEYVSRTS